MKNNQDFYLKQTLLSNAYCWWYVSHKAFCVALPITAVGLPQITRSRKNAT